MAQSAGARRAAQRKLARQIRSGTYERQFTRETRRARQVRTNYVRSQTANVPRPPTINQIKSDLISHKRAAFSDTFHFSSRGSARAVNQNHGNASAAKMQAALSMSESEMSDRAERAARASLFDYDDLSADQREDLEWAFLWYH